MGAILAKLAKGDGRKAAKTRATEGASDKGWPVSNGQELKIVVCGSGGVGKSAFTIQFVANHFIEGYDPTIEDSYRKQHMVDTETAMLEILDTAGQEEFSAMRDQWYRQGDAFIILYTITERSTFEEVKKFYDLVLRAKDVSTPGPILIVGHKADLERERQVSNQEGKDLAKALGASFIEASAKTKFNVEEAWCEVVRVCRTAAASRRNGGAK